MGMKIDLSPVRRTFEIPEAPNAPFVIDGRGFRYHRTHDGEYWFNQDDPQVRGTYAWHDLLFQRGPVTVDE